MYNDNKYQHVCTSEISYLTYLKIKNKYPTSKNGANNRQIHTKTAKK